MMPIAEQIAQGLLVCPVSHLPLVQDGEWLLVSGGDSRYPLTAGLPILLTDPNVVDQRLRELAISGPLPPPYRPGAMARIGRCLRGEGLRLPAARRAWAAVARGAGLRLAVAGRVGHLEDAEDADDLVRVHYRLEPGADVIGDPYALPYADGAANAVILDGVLEQVERPDQVLRQALRVLHPGGELWVGSAQTPPPPGTSQRPRTLTAAGIAAMVVAAGFEVRAAGATAGPIAGLSGLVATTLRSLVQSPTLGRVAAAAGAALLLPWRLLDRLIADSGRVLPLSPGHWLRARRPAIVIPSGPLRLHIGAGSVRLPGWLNVDLQALPGVDIVADVTQGLLFRDVEAIYAEHFLEHLRLDHAVNFLADSWRALGPAGVLRLSTPNLDWVLSTHHLPLEAPREQRLATALSVNLGFHGWRHQFLWSRETLEEVLLACGFVNLSWHRHGESQRPMLRGIEHHEIYLDEPQLPHVLIVEAEKGPAQPQRLRILRAEMVGKFLNQMEQ